MNKRKPTLVTSRPRAFVYPERLIAHRGGGDRAPENTLAGLRAAAAAGYGAVEFDVMLSGDGVPVLMHDETLERTTNGHGRVADTTAAALARLDAGSWFDRKYAGETVPTLQQALSLCLDLGLWPNIEIKPTAGQEEITGSVVAAAVAAYWPAYFQAPLLSSFSVPALQAARQQAPDLPRALLVTATAANAAYLPAPWPEKLAAVGAVALHGGLTLNAVQVTALRAMGYALACYTVNDSAAAARLQALGVDAIFTDRLAWGRQNPGA